MEFWERYASAYVDYVFSVWANVYLTDKASGKRDRLLYYARCLGFRFQALEDFQSHAKLMAQHVDDKLEWAKTGAHGDKVVSGRDTLMERDSVYMRKVVGCNTEWTCYLEASIAMVDGMSEDMRMGRNSIDNTRAASIVKFHEAIGSLALARKKKSE